MGNSNPSHCYTMSNIPLTKTAEEKDLGVNMDNELKFHKHSAYAVKKASKMFGLFRATFTCLDEITVPKIFMAMVRPLDYRRRRGDMLQVFRILNGLDPQLFSKLSKQTSTQGHCQKLYKDHSRQELRKHVFSQRIINDWNSLPELVITSKSVRCSTTMSVVDFERRLEGGRGVEIWVMELWGVFHSSLLNPLCKTILAPYIIYR